MCLAKLLVDNVDKLPAVQLGKKVFKSDKEPDTPPPAQDETKTKKQGRGNHKDKGLSINTASSGLRINNQ